MSMAVGLKWQATTRITGCMVSRGVILWLTFTGLLALSGVRHCPTSRSVKRASLDVWCASVTLW